MGGAAMPTKPRVITIEEHYQDPDVLRAVHRRISASFPQSPRG
jgi:hypothetical protein